MSDKTRDRARPKELPMASRQVAYRGATYEVTVIRVWADTSHIYAALESRSDAEPADVAQSTFASRLCPSRKGAPIFWHELVRGTPASHIDPAAARQMEDAAAAAGITRSCTHPEHRHLQ